MTGQTLNGAAERLQYLLNELATQVVLAGDAAATPGKQSWLDSLEKLLDEASAANQPGFAVEVSNLKAELLALKAGPKTFFDAAEAGIEKLGESVHSETQTTSQAESM